MAQQALDNVRERAARVHALHNHNPTFVSLRTRFPLCQVSSNQAKALTFLSKASAIGDVRFSRQRDEILHPYAKDPGGLRSHPRHAPFKKSDILVFSDHDYHTPRWTSFLNAFTKDLQGKKEVLDIELKTGDDVLAIQRGPHSEVGWVLCSCQSICVEMASCDVCDR